MPINASAVLVAELSRRVAVSGMPVEMMTAVLPTGMEDRARDPATAL